MFIPNVFSSLSLSWFYLITFFKDANFFFGEFFVSIKEIPLEKNYCELQIIIFFSSLFSCVDVKLEYFHFNLYSCCLSMLMMIIIFIYFFFWSTTLRVVMFVISGGKKNLFLDYNHLDNTRWDKKKQHHNITWQNPFIKMIMFIERKEFVILNRIWLWKKHIFLRFPFFFGSKSNSSSFWWAKKKTFSD